MEKVTFDLGQQKLVEFPCVVLGWEERNLTKKNGINTIADKELTSVPVCLGHVGKIANVSCSVMLTLTHMPLISHIVLSFCRGQCPMELMLSAPTEVKPNPLTLEPENYVQQ